MRQNEATALLREITVTVYDLSAQPKGGLTGLTVNVRLPGASAYTSAFGSASEITGGKAGEYVFTLGGPSDATNEVVTAGTLSYQVYKSDGTTLVTRGTVEIAPALRAADFGAASITNTTIADGLLTAAKLANNSITASTVADGAIDAATFAAGAINAAAVADGAIDAATFAAGAINAAAVADGAIDAATFAANAITSTVIAANAIGASQIASNAIAASKIASDALTAIAGAILSAIVYGTRTVKGILTRQDRNLIGAAANLKASNPAVYMPDGTTPAFATTQDTDAGSRTAATTVNGD